MNTNKDIVKIRQALSAGKSFKDSGFPESLRSLWDETEKGYKWFKENDLQMEVVNEWSDWSSETLEGLMTPWTEEGIAALERGDYEIKDTKKEALSTLVSKADDE